ncbi:hypothetical protein FB451DRAFT_1189101 [Mycena latifolia]|nr:hypothetical protein FB451DRAFT_1189101 [Mycena latifolia]
MGSMRCSVIWGVPMKGFSSLGTQISCASSCGLLDLASARNFASYFPRDLAILSQSCAVRFHQDEFVMALIRMVYHLLESRPGGMHSGTIPLELHVANIRDVVSTGRRPNCPFGATEFMVLDAIIEEFELIPAVGRRESRQESQLLCQSTYPRHPAFFLWISCHSQARNQSTAMLSSRYSEGLIQFLYIQCGRRCGEICAPGIGLAFQCVMMESTHSPYGGSTESVDIEQDSADAAGPASAELHRAPPRSAASADRPIERSD